MNLRTSRKLVNEIKTIFQDYRHQRHEFGPRDVYPYLERYVYGLQVLFSEGDLHEDSEFNKRIYEIQWYRVYVWYLV